MAIRGSSLDPVQQSLDTANAMGSVAASNKEVKKAVESLKASLTEASKKNQSTVDRMMASVDRSTAAMIEYFKTQRSADLIKKSNEQVKATSALASTQNDKTKQNAADVEVDKYVKNSDEINKNLKATATAFSGALGKIQELLGDKKVLLQDNSNLEKLTEAIKSGKVNGLNSFARMTGIDVKGMDKNVIAPLVSELINAVKSGKTLEQAVTEPSDTVEEPAESKEAEKKKPEDVVGAIPEAEFRKKICEYIDAENEKREEEEREKKKEKKEADKKHRTIKELLEESNLLSRIGVIAHIAGIAAKLLPWLAGAYGIWSIIKDVKNSVDIISSMKQESNEYRRKLQSQLGREHLMRNASIGLRNSYDPNDPNSERSQNSQYMYRQYAGELQKTSSIGDFAAKDEKKALKGYIILLTNQFVDLLDKYVKKIAYFIKDSQWIKDKANKERYINEILNYTVDTANALTLSYNKSMSKAKNFAEARQIHDGMCRYAADSFINLAIYMGGNAEKEPNLPAFVNDTYTEAETAQLAILADETTYAPETGKAVHATQIAKEDTVSLLRNGKNLMPIMEKSKTGSYSSSNIITNTIAGEHHQVVGDNVPRAVIKVMNPTLPTFKEGELAYSEKSVTQRVDDDATARRVTTTTIRALHPALAAVDYGFQAMGAGSPVDSLVESINRLIHECRTLNGTGKDMSEQFKKLAKTPSHERDDSQTIPCLLTGSSAEDAGGFFANTNRRY